MYHSTEISDGLPVSVPRHDQKLIAELIQEYEALERGCDAVIEREAELARALYRVSPDGSHNETVESGGTFPDPEPREFQPRGSTQDSLFSASRPAEVQKIVALGTLF